MKHIEDEILELKPIGGIECYMATPLSEVLANIESSLTRKLTEIEHLPEFGKSKGNEPFAIAGGGPSIKYTIDTLKNFKVIIACGSSHDWLVEHGIRPTYTLILDPDIIAANYLQRPSPTCNYLVASCCHPRVFDVLKDYPVTIFHSTGPDPAWYIEQWDKHGLKEVKKPIIGGGCTCGLRAITIGMLLGYRKLHFFGLDSNLDINTYDHHAYEFVEPEKEELGDVVEMRLGGPNGRYFKVAKYMMAQLWGFKELIMRYGDKFDVTVHGDSIIYEFMRMRRALIEDKKRKENVS